MVAEDGQMDIRGLIVFPSEWYLNEAFAMSIDGGGYFRNVVRAPMKNTDIKLGVCALWGLTTTFLYDYLRRHYDDP